MTKFAAILCVLFVVVPPALAQDDDVYDLRPHWKPGQSATYEFWARRDQAQAMSIPGGRSQEFHTRLETAGEVTWAVDKVRPDGSSTCTMTMDWITITLTDHEGAAQTIDSRKGRGDVPRFHKMLKAIAGAPITVDVAADGSITKVAGVDKMRRKAEDPDDVPEELDWIESASDLAALAGAPASLKLGRSWKQNFRWTHEMGHMKQDMTYTLTSVEDVEGIPLATVDGQAKLKLEFDRSDIPPDAPPITVKLRAGVATTQVLFDLQRHEAVGRNTTQTDTIDVTMRLPQGVLKRTVTTDIQSQVLRLSER